MQFSDTFLIGPNLTIGQLRAYLEDGMPLQDDPLLTRQERGKIKHAENVGRRKAVLAKTDKRCWYCGQRFGVHRHERPTLDHIKPKVKGGSDEVDNLVPACGECNCAKDSMDYEEFRETYFKGERFYGETLPLNCTGHGTRETP